VDLRLEPLGDEYLEEPRLQIRHGANLRGEQQVTVTDFEGNCDIRHS